MSDPVVTPPLEDDPSILLPLEAARAALMHWWREPVAGILSLAVGCFDSWYFGRNEGLTASLDEILVISGIVLIAGSRRLFGVGERANKGNGGNGATSSER